MAESTTLVIEDLHEVLEAVYEVRDKWFSFGLALGIDEPSLRKIESDCFHDPDACLRKLLSFWLRNCRNPSWDDIVNALRSKIVGHKHVANKIVQSKPCSEDVIIDAEEAAPHPEILLPSAPVVDAEQLQTAFKMTTVVSRYYPVANWLETNDRIGKSESTAGNQGTELQSRGVPESEREITIEESNTHDDVSLADGASTPQHRELISSSNHSMDYGTFSLPPEPNVTTVIRRGRCFTGGCCWTISSVVTLVLLLIMVVVLIIPSSTSGSFFINQTGVVILAGQIFPFIDTSVTFETNDETNQHIEFYAERCSNVVRYEELDVTSGNFSAPGNNSLLTDYLLTGSSVSISINTTNADTNLTGCLSRILIFDNPVQYVKFIVTGQWSNPLAESCVQNTSFSYTYNISQTAHYYSGLYVPPYLDGHEIYYEVSEKAFRYNISGFEPGCFLSSKSCTLSLERYCGHGPDVCLFALLTPGSGSENEYTEFSYELDLQSTFYILTGVPMGILFLAMLVMMVIRYCF